MPNTRFHVGLGLEVLRKHHIENASDFLVGCVFPDAHWLSFSSPAKITVRAKLHHSNSPKDYAITIAGVHEWIAEYAEAVKFSDFYKGYMLHMLLDANCNTLWNAHTKPIMYDIVCFIKDGNHKQMGWESLCKRKWEDAQEASEHLYPTIGKLPDISRSVSKDCKSALSFFNLYDDELQLIVNEIHRDTERDIEPTVQIALPVQQNYDMISLTLNEYMHWTEIISRM